MSPFAKMIIYPSIGLFIAFGWHFATVLGWIGTAPLTRAELFVRIMGFFFAFLIVTMVIGGFIASRHERDAQPDEREEQVAAKSERLGVSVMYAGLLAVMWFAFSPMTPMQMANAILATVCISELVKVIYATVLLKGRV